MKGILENSDKDMWCYVAKKCYKCLKSIINTHFFNVRIGLIVIPIVWSSLKHFFLEFKNDYLIFFLNNYFPFL
jgi:hypothetical protein